MERCYLGNPRSPLIQRITRRTNRSTRQANGYQRRLPLPNPYRVPGTRFSIDFRTDEETYHALSQPDVVGCLRQARDAYVQLIEEHGDSPLPEHDQHIFGTVEFGIYSTFFELPEALTYSETLSILRAFSKKTRREGYHLWHGTIFLTVAPAGADQLGDSLLAEAIEG